MALEVEVEPVLDLTTRAGRRRIGATKQQITGDTRDCKRACRAVADRARLDGAQALLAPSAARDDGRVLAIYIDVGPPELVTLQEIPDAREPLNYGP